MTLVVGLRGWGKRAVPLLNCSLAFDLQFRKITENLSQRSRIVLGTTRCVDFAIFLGRASIALLAFRHLRLSVGDFRQPLVGTSAF
jgi:hypothetical protein